METESIEQCINLDGMSYLVKADITYSHDPNYGADADGRRGIPMDFVEEIEITSIIDTELGIDVEITDELHEKLEDKIDV